MDINHEKEYLAQHQHLKMGVIGSRTFENYPLLEMWIKRCMTKYKVDFIVSGGRRPDGKGADTLAENYADQNKIDKIIFPADWDLHGKIAGPLRNEKIAKYSDFILSFWDEVSGGTQDCMDKAFAQNKVSFIINFGGRASIYEPVNYP